MQPSAFYADEEKTYAGGFTYKVTTSAINALYSLNDTLDNTISYTTPKNSKLDVMEMGGWNNSSASAYVDKQLYFKKDFGSNGHSNINSLTVSKGSFAEAGKTTICFAANPGAGYYYFGNSAEGSATKGSLNCKLITDMEINKIVFRASIPTGWTKEDFEAFESDGSLADNDGYEIPFADFMANPGNYYIRTFSISALGYWDGSTWKANNLTNSPQIAPVFITDNAKTTGFLTFNKHHFDNAPGTGQYGVSNISVYNSSATNATDVNSWQRGAVVSGLSSTSGYILGQADTILLTPDLTGIECEDLTSQGVLGAGTTLPAKTLPFWDALKVYKYDRYTLTADSGSSGPSHFTRYNYYFCVGMRGDYLYKLLAYIGAYFYTGSLTDLNNSGATPDNMAVTGMKLGEMDADGNTTGNWIGPDAMPAYQGINKGGSIVHPGYNPSGGGGDDDDFDDHEMGAGTGISGMANLWLLTKAQLDDLHSAFNSAPGGFDPMNSLISVMGLGVAPIYLFNDIEVITPINIRKSDGTSWSTGVEGHIVDAQKSAFQFTGITVNRMYNNFLDFSPYAIHEIFIPMCGWLTLPDIAVDRSITVTYLPDVESLKCRAVVSVVDNSGHRCVIGEKDGIMGADVPFTNTGHSLYVGESIINGMNVAGEVITGAIGAGFTKTNAKGGTYRPYEGFTVGMGGTLPGAIGNAIVSGQTNRTHYMTGNGTRIGFSDGENIQIKSTYHKIDKPDNYDHTVGKVCNKTGLLSSFNGFTVCDNPHINISALEEEKSEIKALLEQGVILPSGE